MTTIVINRNQRSVWKDKVDTALEYLTSEVAKADDDMHKKYKEYQTSWKKTLIGRFELLFNKNAKAPTGLFHWYPDYPNWYPKFESRIRALNLFTTALNAEDSTDIHASADVINLLEVTLLSAKHTEKQ